MLKRVVLLAISLAIPLVLFEIGLRVFASVPDPFERGTLIEWWDAPPNRYVPSAHVPASRTFHPDPEILPGLTESVTFTTNAFGFRSPRLRTIEKPDSQLRIFAIGGSTTECSYLDDADAWPEGVQERLAAVLPNVDVVNAGHSGDTTRDHIPLLAQRVVPFRPDFVLLLAGANDIGLQMASDYSPLRQDSRSSLRILEPRLKELVQSRLSRRSHVARLGILAGRRLTTQTDQNNPIQDEYGRWVEDMRAEMRSLPLVEVDVERYPLPEFSQNLRSLIGIARSNGIEPVLLTQPALWGAEAGAWESRLWTARTADYRFSHAQAAEILDRFNDVTRAVAAELNVPLVDLAREISRSPDFYYDDEHFTIRGAQAVADAVARSLLPIVCKDCRPATVPTPD